MKDARAKLSKASDAYYSASHHKIITDAIDKYLGKAFDDSYNVDTGCKFYHKVTCVRKDPEEQGAHIYATTILYDIHKDEYSYRINSQVWSSSDYLKNEIPLKEFKRVEKIIKQKIEENV